MSCSMVFLSVISPPYVACHFSCQFHFNNSLIDLYWPKLVNNTSKASDLLKKKTVYVYNFLLLRSCKRSCRGPGTSDAEQFRSGLEMYRIQWLHAKLHCAITVEIQLSQNPQPKIQRVSTLVSVIQILLLLWAWVVCEARCRMIVLAQSYNLNRILTRPVQMFS